MSARDIRTERRRQINPMMSPGRHVLLLLLLLPLRTGAFFGWFTRKSSSVKSASQKEPAPDPQTLPGAPFEMITTDEKFLAEAKDLELSPLDSCNYKVVSQLRASCTEMSEEEIAKFGVLLFNCQAEVEGRKTYSCTEDMTLAECTSSMDPDTWNAYHIVSNRARSVCYAARQLHFRRRTELTVNTLVSTAMNQLEAMKMLKVAMDKIPQRHLGAVFDALSESKNLSPNSSICSNMSVSSMSPRAFCQAITRAGQPCRNKASGGQEFCRVHASGQTSYITS
ncbi:protein brambleberry-like [Hyla sarda]|uniref:protein brambleberry-like n=1 Tax=Hyla sarda TaxID=327740 RepID=UPI0024C23D91|nr:protein brambleberry-like [Hyla sarda]